MRDRLCAIALIVLLFVGSSDLLANENDTYLTPENFELFNSGQCGEHVIDPKYERHIRAAYALELCSNVYSVRDNNHIDGWKLHRTASAIINDIPCECPLHPHSDIFSYRVYLEVVELLANGKAIESNTEQFCAEAKALAYQ